MLFCCCGRDPVGVIMAQKEGLGRRRVGVWTCAEKRAYPNFGLDLGCDYRMMFLLCLHSSWHSGNPSDLMESSRDFSSRKHLCSSPLDSLYEYVWIPTAERRHNSEMRLMGFGVWMLWMWRKMRISSLIWILHLMNLSKGQEGTNVPRWKRKYHPVLWDLWFIFPAEDRADRDYIWRQ